MHVEIEALVARITTSLRVASSAWTTSAPKLRRALFALRALLRVQLVTEDVLTGFPTEAGLGEPA